MAAEFEPLLARHDEFLETLLLHQEALVRGDLESAADLIGELADELAAHIRHEEECLLPVLESRGGWCRFGEPRFYREDHERILALVAELAGATRELDRGGARRERAVALLIGREQAFRSLLEHHDDRERRGLFPDLARVTSPQEREALVAAAG